MVTRADAGAQADPPSQPADIRPTDRGNEADLKSSLAISSHNKLSTISGLITDEKSGSPIYATVRLYDDPTSSSSIAIDYTSLFGEYQFSRLSAGTYYLSIEASDHLDEYYDNKSTLAEADPIAVAENSSVNIDVALGQGGIISGTITSSATGSPVSGVNVRAYEGNLAALQGDLWLWVKPLHPQGCNFNSPL